jgi:hypothetical protein
MALPIKKFGQTVRLVVTSESEAVVFETSELRIDFEVFNISGFQKVKIDIFNCDPKTVLALSNGELYATIYTTLHDGKEQVITDKVFISNALQEVKLPEKVLSLYCVSGAFKKSLQNQISLSVSEPSLKNIISACARSAEFEGEVEYKYFPEGKHERIPPNPISNQKGSFINCLTRLSEEYRFNFYVEGSNLIIMYKPDAKDLEKSGMFSKESEEVTLDSRNMRQNPKIGPSQLQVTANLDGDLVPGLILNVSDLITATVGGAVNTEALQVAQGILKDSTAGFAKYQALTVIHNGSNYTNMWQTRVMAVSPNAGTEMSTQGTRWWTNG